ncbi:MAG: hypothetical protein AAFN65_15765, partial [Bacteroidota bacterium]
MMVYPFWLGVLLLAISRQVAAQDTLVTQYPNTQQRWEKIFLADEKVAENIYYENGAPWMT